MANSWGDKSGGSHTRFYRRMIVKSDARFDAHLILVTKEKERQKQKEKGNK
jgi:hypothetical protein